MSAQGFESCLARLFTDDAFRECFFQDSREALTGQDLTSEEKREIADLDRTGLLMASRSYARKRSCDAVPRFEARQTSAESPGACYNLETMPQDSRKPAAARSPWLDQWRGLACLMVFFNHTGVSVNLPPFVIYGYTGVHLFFALSGYLIFKPFIRMNPENGGAPSIPRFYRRRLLRLYPPYLFALAVFAGTRHLSGIHPPSPANLLAHLGLVFNYTHPRNFFSINAVFWSLAIEVQFYVLLPLVCAGLYRLFRRTSPRNTTWMIVGLFLLSGPLARAIEFNAFREYAALNPEWVRFRSVFSFLDLFGFGMAAATLESFGHLRGIREKSGVVALCVTGLVCFLGANFWCLSAGGGGWMNVADITFTVGYPLLLMLGIFLFFIGLISLRRDPVRSGTRFGSVLAWVGRLSYSLYLIHVAVQLVVFRFVSLDGIHEFWIRAALFGWIALPPTLVVSALMFRWIERPCLEASSKAAA